MENRRSGGTNRHVGPTIRYYEEIGLLRRATRQGGGQRVYTRNDVERLTFIRRCREFGFSIEQVRTLLSILQDPNSSCGAVRDLAVEHLTDVRIKLRELKALERRLVSFVKSCDTSCAGGPGPDCIVLGDLAKSGDRRRPSVTTSPAAL